MSRYSNSPAILLLTVTIAWFVIALQALNSEERRPVADEFVYLSIADQFDRTGTFTDGIFSRSTSPEKPPGRFFTPAYPVFLAVAAKFDPAVRNYVRCFADKRKVKDPDCPGQPASLIILQSLFAAVAVACVFAIALMLGGSLAVAVLAAIMALWAGEGAYFARTYLSENAAFLFFYLFLAFGVAAFKHNRRWQFAACGLALGFAVLARPSYLYLGYALTISIIIMALVSRRHFRWNHAAAFAAGAVIVTAPWMMRNLMEFGDLGLTSGYGGFILVQRISYNAMTPVEWLAALVYWLPDFGDKLAATLFSAETISRLNYVDPNSFYLIGNGALRGETLKAAGGPEYHLSYLLKNYVVGDFFKHVLVTIPMTLKGIWAGNYLSLLAIALLVPMYRAMKQRGLLLPFLFLAGSPFFMAALHGFVSVNVIRYNLPLVALYAFCASYALFDFLEHRGWLPAALRQPMLRRFQ